MASTNEEVVRLGIPQREISMHQRMVLVGLLVVLLISSASCGGSGDGPTGAVPGPALVEFLDLSGRGLKIAVEGVTIAGDGGRYCASVATRNANVVVRDPATTVPVGGFSPAFQLGGTFAVFMYRGAGGVTSFTTARTTFTPAPGNAGIRVVNGGASSYDVYFTDTEVALTGLAPTVANVGPGVATSFANIPAAPHFVEVTTAGSKTVIGSGRYGFTEAFDLTLALLPALGSSVITMMDQACTAAAN